NKEIFDKYNITPPKTFEELKEICKKLRAEGVIPISLGNAPKWTGAFYFIYLADRIAGPELFEKAVAREPGYSFADPAYIEAGRKLQELVDIGAFPEGFNGMSYDEQRMLFATEKAAMMLMGTWLPGVIEKEMPGITAKMDFFMFPAVEGGKGNPANVVGGTNTAYAIASTCKHPELAVELLKELSSDETVKELVEVVGRVSGVKVEVDATKVPPLTLKAMKTLETAGHLQLYYDQYLPPAMAETHKDTTQALFGKTMTPEEAAQAMEEAAKKELGGQ
ncbi:MAG TPA: extracellular solute-binding protein, partial [Anaerolineae bacterium]|nr:extracellular solute-binding protein [Anaerolineae bacterium]